MRLLFFLFTGWALCNSVTADTGTWLLVDTKNLTLQVKRGLKTVAVFNDIAIGRGGAGEKKIRGDDITPLGTYTIRWINRKSDYYVFYGFDYPSVTNVQKAFKQGNIDTQTYHAVLRAHRTAQAPPQDTVLGGQIGIHGLGRGDIRIHRMTNWTHGCVALTNEQIDRLDRWIDEGTVVVIK